MTTATIIIFIATYIGIIFTRLPRVNVDRPSAAFFGAVAMIVIGAVELEEAVSAIDFNTISLLLGMMILIAVLELDGFFTLVAQKTISLANNAFQLLFIIVFVTGISSAFLVNDAVVLLFTPVVIQICRAGKLNPLPFLIAEILASNIGSAMTITGNPQNILIGIQSGIPYGFFLLYLLPISLIGMIIVMFFIRFYYRKKIDWKNKIEYEGNDTKYNYASIKVSVPVFILVVILFFFSHIINMSIPVIALFGASLVLLFGKIKPSKVIKEVDWVLLLFFAGLFIVVYGVEKTGVFESLIESTIINTTFHGITGVHVLSLIFSQIVSNVPYVIIMLPVFNALSSDTLWLALAASSTLAGNATIIGAMVNLIVIEVASKNGYEIKFRDFFKPGIIVTIITLFVSILILYLEYSWGIIS